LPPEAVVSIQSARSTGFDYLLKVRTNDIESYRQVLGDGIAKLPHLQQSSTFVVMETVIDGSTIPVKI